MILVNNNFNIPFISKKIPRLFKVVIITAIVTTILKYIYDRRQNSRQKRESIRHIVRDLHAIRPDLFIQKRREVVENEERARQICDELGRTNTCFPIVNRRGEVIATTQQLTSFKFP